MKKVYFLSSPDTAKRCGALSNECLLIEAVFDGKTLIAALSKNSVSAVILDFDYACVFGDDFYYQLYEFSRKIPFFVASKENSPYLNQKLAFAGVKAVIPLPFNADIVSKNLMFYENFSEKKSVASAEEKQILSSFIGETPEVLHMKEELLKIASSDIPVHICGESGTGKSIVAGIIHRLSDRKKAPYLEESMANFNDELADAKLFGSTKGGFTGAENNAGLVEIAKGGVLFLDEIAECSVTLQGKLLRMLSSKKARRVGSYIDYDVDVRLITATNKELWELAKEEKFKADLYYRIMGYMVKLPPLRERIADIPLLAESFLKKKKIISPSAMEKLTSYSWPGNVRELETCISIASAESNDIYITASDIRFVPSPFK